MPEKHPPNRPPLILAINTALRFSTAYARRLVNDLDEAQMTAIPGPGHENHPAFTLGHLITALDLIAQDLGQPSALPPGWAKLFLRRGPADRRTPDANASYPPRDQLLTELDRQTQRAIDAISATEPAWFAAQAQPWKLSGHLPTNADLILFMANAHTAMHLGQLAAWRRAMGLPAAMADMR